MKQKSQVFRNKIRANQLQQYFSQKRKSLKQHLFQQDKTIIISNPATSNEIAIESNETISSTQTTADYLQQWRQNQNNIEKYLAVGSFQLMVNIFQDIYHSLKKIHWSRRFTQASKNQLTDSFLRLNILSKIIRSVLEAHMRRLSPGLLQVLTHSALKILMKLIGLHPKQFTQTIFISSDLLKFFAACLTQPKFDKKHIQLVMSGVMHMITASRAKTYKLFQILNSKQRGQFNIAAIFYNISNMNLQSSQIVTHNFIEMIRYYFVTIDELQQKNKKGETSINTEICLNSHHMDICFEITIKYVDFYLRMPISIQSNQQSLCDGLELLRILVQHSQINSKWLDRINYKRLIQLLRSSNTPYFVNSNILIMIDHLIYLDPTERLTQFFVRQCELISVIWTLKKDFFGYVLNILTNIASMEAFKPQLSPYCHQIFINLQFSPSYILYQFLYNWFNAQDFQIRESKDNLAIRLLQQSTEQKKQITDLQSMIWLRLAQVNQLRIPTRILELDNQCSRLLISMLKGNDFEEEV